MLRPQIVIIIFAITILLILTFLLTKKNFHAKFYNKTGQNIDSLFVGTTLIGHLSVEDSTEFISFSKFQFDSGYPYEKLTANLQKKNINQINWSWCGTEQKIKSDGSYAFDIKVKNENGVSYLYLVKHGGQLFNWQ
jgi:hypothetical protein